MIEYCYSREYVVALRRRCRRLGCSAPPSFWTASPATLQACYNGIGPESWSPRFRNWVTKTLEEFEVAALPHDFEYSRSPRNYFAFTLANLRFASNAALEARDRRSWRVLRLGLALAAVCQLWGYRGYREAL